MMISAGIPNNSKDVQAQVSAVKTGIPQTIAPPSVIIEYLPPLANKKSDNKNNQVVERVIEIYEIILKRINIILPQ